MAVAHVIPCQKIRKISWTIIDQYHCSHHQQGDENTLNSAISKYMSRYSLQTNSACHSTGVAITYIVQQLNNAIYEKQEVKLICLGNRRKVAWHPDKSLTLLAPKPTGCDLQKHGEIQNGICLICMDGSLRNITRQACCHPAVNIVDMPESSRRNNAI